MRSVAPTIAIFGGGPAGLSAALWLANLGLTPVVLEPAPQLGGLQNLNFLANDWVLGLPGLTGPQMARQFADHVSASGIRCHLSTSPIEAMRGAEGFVIRLRTAEGEAQLAAHAIILATGTRYRAEEVLCEVSGFASLPENSVRYGPHAFGDLETVAGKRVLIVGGGDNAYENARLVAAQGGLVHLVTRSAPRAQQGLRESVAGRTACREWLGFNLSRFAASAGAVNVSLCRQGGEGVNVEVDRLHVLAGYAPNTDFIPAVFGPLAERITLAPGGYLHTDAAGRTTLPGLYGAGDVANPAFPNVVSALAQGAQAAKSVEFDLRGFS